MLYVMSFPKTVLIGYDFLFLIIIEKKKKGEIQKLYLGALGEFEYINIYLGEADWGGPKKTKSRSGPSTEIKKRENQS